MRFLIKTVMIGKARLKFFISQVQHNHIIYIEYVSFKFEILQTTILKLQYVKYIQKYDIWLNLEEKVIMI